METNPVFLVQLRLFAVEVFEMNALVKPKISKLNQKQRRKLAKERTFLSRGETTVGSPQGL